MLQKSSRAIERAPRFYWPLAVVGFASSPHTVCPCLFLAKPHVHILIYFIYVLASVQAIGRKYNK